MKYLRSTLLPLCLLVATAMSGSAQESPRVALVLSGGGAKGIAHVGVLQFLEEMRVPVHCIAGTSMGALVGGAYASGFSVQKLEEAISSADWERLFSSTPHRSFIPFHQKQEDWLNFFDFTINMQGTRIYPVAGLINTHNLHFFFRELTGFQPVMDFDQMPIPFRAIGTDLESGEAVTMSRGDLSTALLASMSVPGVFPPVYHEGRLLFDGALVNNLPIAVALRDCKPDLIIAVNISPDTDTGARADEPASILTVAQRITEIPVQYNVRHGLQELRPYDLLISPRVGSYSASDFTPVRPLIAEGYRAAALLYDQLRPLSLSPGEYDQWYREHRTPLAHSLSIRTISLPELTRVNPDVLQRRLRLDPQQAFDQSTLHASLNRIYASGDFERLDYHLSEEPGNGTHVIISATERPGGDFLRFGMELYTDSEGDSRFTALASYRKTWLNGLGAQWRNTFKIGHERQLYSEFNQPLFLGSELFLAPHISYHSQPHQVYQQEQPIARYNVSHYGTGLEIGTHVGRWGEGRLGIVRRFHRATVQVGDSALPEEEQWQTGYTASITYDQMDNPAFPTQGSAFALDWYATLDNPDSQTSYRRVEGRAAHALSWGRNSVVLSFRGGSGLDTDIPYFDQFRLGGFFNLSAYRGEELVGERVALAQLMAFRHTGSLPVLGKAYSGVLLETGNVWDEPDFSHDNLRHSPWSASLFTALDTGLGPLYLSLAHGSEGRGAAYLFLGIPYY